MQGQLYIGLVLHFVLHIVQYLYGLPATPYIVGSRQHPPLAQPHSRARTAGMLLLISEYLDLDEANEPVWHLLHILNLEVQRVFIEGKLDMLYLRLLILHTQYLYQQKFIS